MEPVPALEIGWLNGWILICLLYLIYGILLCAFPKDVVVRLYDKSGRSKRQRSFVYVGSLLAFVYFVLIILTPLKIGADVFIIGTSLYVLGLAGFIIALFNFKNAPHDQPVIRRLYRISRHPQQLMFFIAFLGICIAIGSWLALFIQIMSSLFIHYRVLAEEKTCLERYGDSYSAYMKSVPRYFLIKTHMKEEGENIRKKLKRND
jgi:protein-S-isoprenylcysteine O-methyltransferase Ste14